LKTRAEIFVENRNPRHSRNVKKSVSCLTPVHKKKRNGFVSPGEGWIFHFCLSVLEMDFLLQANTGSKQTRNLKYSS
jgi:hypothetical protein